MGILNTLINELNNAEQEKPEGERGEWKRMHSQPEELITIRGMGILRRAVDPQKYGSRVHAVRSSNGEWAVGCCGQLLNISKGNGEWKVHLPCQYDIPLYTARTLKEARTWAENHIRKVVLGEDENPRP